MRTQAVIYARTSSDDETGDSKSIPQQIEDCKKLCEQSGYTVKEVIREPNRSGRTYPTGAAIYANDFITREYVEKLQTKFKTRDGLARALSLLDENTVLVARDVERIYRPLTNSYFGNYIPQVLGEKKTIAHTVSEGVRNYSDFSTNIVQTIQQTSVDHEIRKRSKLSQEKLKWLIDNGYTASGANVTGYKNAGQQKVTIVEKEAEVIRFIFKEKIEKNTANNAIVKALNEMKALGKTWSIQQLLKVLDRPIYFGYSRNLAKQLILSKVYPSILPKYTIEDFKRIHAQRVKNRELRTRTGKGNHPISGLVFCGFCKARMVITKAPAYFKDKPMKPTYYYRCSMCGKLKASDETKGCRKASITEETLLSFFNNFNPLFYLKQSTAVSDYKATKAEIEALEAQKATLQTKQNQLLDNGDLSSSVITKALQRFEEQIKEVEGKLTNLHAIPKPVELKTVGIGKGGIQYHLAPEVKDQFFKALIERVEVYFTKVTVKLAGFDAFDVERIPVFNTRNLPPVEAHTKQGTLCLTLTYVSAGWTGNKKLKANKDVKTLLKQKGLTIETVGYNPKYGEGRAMRGATIKTLPQYVLENKPLS